MIDRESFEEAAARLGYNLTMDAYETGEYHYPATQDAWLIWQEALEYARAQSEQGVEPVAWSWEYRGLHVSTDKAFIEKIAADGFAVRPLVFADTQPAQQGSVPEGNRWVKCSERLPTHSNPVQAITNDYPALGVAVVPARYVDGNGWTDIDNTDRDGDESPLSEVVAWREMCEIPTGLKRPQPPQEGEGNE